MAIPATDRRPTGLLEAREIVKDLFRPKPAVYWLDFLGSAALGWGAFFVIVFTDSLAAGLAAAPVAVLALYRALLFIHELTHLEQGAVKGFSTAWNLLAGVPLLVPSLTYEGVHTDHHRRAVYGTPLDPEYLPLAAGPRWRVAWFILETLLAPLLFLARFIIVAPVALLVPPLHRWLERRASSLVINPAYVRRELDAAERRRLAAFEILILVVWGGAAVLVARGIIPLRILPAWYGVSAAIALVNQVRTLAAHRFRNVAGELDVVGQLADTVNIPHGAFIGILAPVGLRFHALHHWLPALPYHALAAAHERLLKALPESSPYHAVNAGSLSEVIATIWREASGRKATCPSSISIGS